MASVENIAVNIHAASPQYPGRDPHHYAIYDQAEEYGATLHYMIDRVDAGGIIDALSFEVPQGCSPQGLMSLANQHAYTLIQKWLPQIISGDVHASSKYVWSENKKTRKDFCKMTQLDTTVSKDEFDKIYQAFHVDGYHNLTLDLHGHRFRWEGPVTYKNKQTWEDFTEAQYRYLIARAKEKMDFLLYTDQWTDKPHTIWRHDVDYSPQRSLALAKIEKEFDVQATYLIQVDSLFYDLNDPATIKCFQEIQDMGHQLGLHFDANPLEEKGATFSKIEHAISESQKLIENKFDTHISVISFHMPSDMVLNHIEQTHVCGLINTYNHDLKSKYYYCSDSNGYWRHRSLFDVVGDPNVLYLHALTHPVWWTPEALPPKERIARCANGRAAYLKKFYNDLVQGYGRKNEGWEE